MKDPFLFLFLLWETWGREIISGTNNCLNVCIGRDVKPDSASQNIIMAHKVGGWRNPMA